MELCSYADMDGWWNDHPMAKIDYNYENNFHTNILVGSKVYKLAPDVTL